jgi:glycosyltransferase involved in cell wall biosynthesis
MARKISSLFVIQFGSNVGYAIAPLETLFYEVGVQLAQGDTNLVHFAYRDVTKGRPQSLPPDYTNYFPHDVYDTSPASIAALAAYVRDHGIHLVMFFDISPISPLFRALRAAGAKTLLSYYGAPLSSPMPLWKLAIKKAIFALSRSRLDGLIFESRAMADLAVGGRGVSSRLIDIVPLGVNIAKFQPGHTDYAHAALGIPQSHKIVIYAGHMERRKGVHTLIDAAVELVKRRRRDDVSFVICGNKANESESFLATCAREGIASRVIFGGYRSDMPQLYASCICGVIPSTGWDSFPRTAVEMAAAGLPVVASRLQGLCEAVLDGETGLLFEPGDAVGLANALERMLDDSDLARRLGAAGRLRCERELNLDVQRTRFLAVVRKRMESSAAS